MKEPLDVAIIQYEVQDLDEVGRDAQRLETLARDAADRGAQLVVALETCFYRYEPWEQNGVTMLDLAASYDSLQERFSRLARELGICLVVGLREPWGDAEKPVYNTALCFGPDGTVLRKQRKIAPSNREMTWTKAGDPGVFETPFGRAAIMICKTAKTDWWDVYACAGIDLFVLVAGDRDATSFTRFGEICGLATCHGVLCNQICGPEGEGRKGNSAWGYPDGAVEFLGGGEQIFHRRITPGKVNHVE